MHLLHSANHRFTQRSQVGVCNTGTRDKDRIGLCIMCKLQLLDCAAGLHTMYKLPLLDCAGAFVYTIESILPAHSTGTGTHHRHQGQGQDVGCTQCMSYKYWTMQLCLYIKMKPFHMCTTQAHACSTGTRDKNRSWAACNVQATRSHSSQCIGEPHALVSPFFNIHLECAHCMHAKSKCAT